MATEAVVQRMKLPWRQISNQELTVKKAEQIVRRWQVCPQTQRKVFTTVQTRPDTTAVFA